MEHRSVNQIGNVAVNEVKSAIDDVQHATQDENTDLNKEMERTARKMEQHAKNAVKVVEAVAGAWGKGGAERSKEWEIEM